MIKKILLIDLDGVLNEYNGSYDKNFIPKIKKGAKNFLKKLNNEYELHLYTTRNLLLASKWLIENDLDKFFKDVTNIKTPAYLYIDDRTVCFSGDYEKTIEDVRNFQVYWK